MKTTRIPAGAKGIDSPAEARAAKAAQRPNAADGYGEAATRFIARARGAFSNAWDWAGETGSGLPATAKRWGLTDTASMQHRMGDNPLVLGVMGLGIGAALGMMIPSAAGKNPPAPRKSRRK